MADGRRRLPLPMWERKTTPTKMPCQRCKEQKRTCYKRQTRVDGGPVPGYYLICPVCDGTAGAVPPELRA